MMKYMFQMVKYPNKMIIVYGDDNIIIYWKERWETLRYMPCHILGILGMWNATLTLGILYLCMITYLG